MLTFILKLCLWNSPYITLKRKPEPEGPVLKDYVSSVFHHFYAHCFVQNSVAWPQPYLLGRAFQVAQRLESTCQCRRHKTCMFNPWVGKIPWRRKWQPTPVFLAGEFHEQRSLVGYSPWGHKELDMTEQLSAHIGKTLANSQGEKTLWGKHTPMISPKNFFQSFVMLLKALCIFCR